jgi:hypothetical protein
MSIAAQGHFRPTASAHAALRARAGAHERSRRHLVKVVLLVYLLLIFEGALRKWVIPQLSFYIFFIRDPFVVYAYIYAARHRLWPKHSPFVPVFVSAGALGILVGSLQLLIDSGGGSTKILLALYGWRNYFLYAPLAFLIGANFRAADLGRVARWTLIIAIPMGVLVAVQFWAPQNSPINVGLASDTALQFFGLGLNDEHTRPMGTFSSGAGQIQFVASAFALWLALLITPAKRRPVRWWLLLAAGAGLATCLAMSGSRATVLQTALVAVAALCLGFISRSSAQRLRSIALPGLLAAAALVLFPIVFSEAIEAFATRWETAARTENAIFEGGVFGRALYGFVDFTRLLGQTPLLGYGLGIGGNASTTLGVKLEGENPVSLAETDWARHIVDVGPVLGIVYIVLRVVLAIWVGMLALRAVRRAANPMPWVLYGYVGYTLLLGQITGQGAINGFAWLFTGFCIAAARDQLRGTRRAASGRRAVPRPAGDSEPGETAERRYA